MLPPQPPLGASAHAQNWQGPDSGRSRWAAGGACRGAGPRGRVRRKVSSVARGAEKAEARGAEVGALGGRGGQARGPRGGGTLVSPRGGRRCGHAEGGDMGRAGDAAEAARG
jgi:hypothetical protein